MPTLRVIRRRIQSVRNTAKITKAMELIAGTKMRRAQQRVLAGRPYADKLHALFAHLAALPPEPGETHPLLQRRAVRNLGLVEFSPDRGLAGGLPSNLNRRTGAFILEHREPVLAVAVGKKGRDFLVRSGQALRAEFTGLGDQPKVVDITALARLIIDWYTQGTVDQVSMVYPRFVSTMVQRAVVEPLLPIDPVALAEGAPRADYIFEPSRELLLDAVLPRFVEMTLYHVLLETIACEQSARMVAMRSATDNANEMIVDLTLTYNKARQESITKELLDIVGASAALE
ncbi:MAG: ATP synthase F1 subunit gamma [Dehalococcoidia bacterium]|nr:ATP synthase F1 subunit gamma [Dehalococcoidia bacterium]